MIAEKGQLGLTKTHNGRPTRPPLDQGGPIRSRIEVSMPCVVADQGTLPVYLPQGRAREAATFDKEALFSARGWSRTEPSPAWRA